MKVGDVVKLRSSLLHMTVVRTCPTDPEGPSVKVAWLDNDNKIEQAYFSEYCLEMVKEL